MTAEERRAYVRRLVDAAPALSAADADKLRHLVPLQSRLATKRAPGRRPTRRQAA